MHYVDFSNFSHWYIHSIKIANYEIGVEKNRFLAFLSQLSPDYFLLNLKKESVVTMAPLSLNIQKDQLIGLYVDQKLSSDTIARRLACNHVTILNYLKKYGIPRRSRLGNRKPVIVAKEILLDFYSNKKLTQKQIAQRFGHSRFGIQRWMKIYGIKSRSDSESHTKYPKKNFSGDLLEKAYMIGFRLGDLNVYKVHELVQARCSTTKKAQVQLINGLFNRYCNVHVWKAKRGTFEIVALLNESFNFLLPKQDSIEDWILLKKDLFLAFLAGYSDAEGCILIRKSNQGNKRPFAGFELATYDKNIIREIGRQLDKLGLVSPEAFVTSRAGIDKRGVRRNKDCWRISIYRKESLWKLLNLLEPFMKHSDRLRALSKAKENIILRNAIPYSRSIKLN